jgi:dienelactone hydrolase
VIAFRKALAAALAALPLCGEAPVGQQSNVTFSDYPAQAESSELLRRLASPLTVVELGRLLAKSGKTLAERSLDLGKERFLVYAPPHAPAKGYGILVFVPPWDDARLPPSWAGVLDKFGVIYVSAANSGNDARPVERREPLALIAEHNIARRYPVDPDRIYVGGFSGGSRVALRLALGYPDVFRGVLLNAGSDPIGDISAPLPSRDLFARFQSATRLVYATGGKDEAGLAGDIDSVSSMRRWCVAGISTEAMPYAGHQAADPAILAHALSDLQTPVRSDPAKQAACQSAIDRDLTRALDEVEALVAAGKNDEARRRLIQLDARFGGLAAPGSIELAGKLDRRTKAGSGL